MPQITSWNYLLSGLLLLLVAGAVIAGIVVAIVMASKKKKAMPQTDTATANGSYFDGGTFAYLGLTILSGFISLITLGIAMPWAKCMLLRWERKHTVIDGRRLAFDGKGGQLFWRNILWRFLTLITFGIYYFWATVKLLKWEASHTYAEGTNDRNSFFDGSGGSYLGRRLLFMLMSVFSLGIAYPWAVKMMLVWEKGHTVVSSNRFVYTGKGSQLLGHYLLWALLTLVTVGIYGLFVPIRAKKLITANTHNAAPVAGYAPAPNMQSGYAPVSYTQSSYSEAIKNDATRYTLAETNRQLRFMQLELKEDTPFDKLYPMVQQNIPEAQYVLGMQLKIKNENDKAEQILGLLKKSADAGFAPAQYEYADSLVADSSKVTDALVEESADYFMKSAKDGFLPAEEQWMHFCLEKGIDETSEGRIADDTLQLGVYWHDIVVERGGIISEEDAILYNAATDILRMKGIYFGISPFPANQQVYTAPSAPAYAPAPQKKSSAGKVLGIVFGIIGGIIAFNLLAALVVYIIFDIYIPNQKPNTSESDTSSSISGQINDIDLEGMWKAVNTEMGYNTLYIFKSDGSYCYYNFDGDNNDINDSNAILYYEEGIYHTTENELEFTCLMKKYDSDEIHTPTVYGYACTFDDDSVSISSSFCTGDVFGSSEQVGFTRFKRIDSIEQLNEDDYDTSEIQTNSDFVKEMIQGEWYCKNNDYAYSDTDFLIVSIDGSDIITANYTCDILTEDGDQPQNNIYYEGGIYGINGGGSRCGYFEIVKNSDTDYQIVITYPEDAQWGEEAYRTLFIVINPERTDRFTVLDDNGKSVHQIFHKGDIEDFRTYKFN